MTGRRPDSNQPIDPQGRIPSRLEILHNVQGQLGAWRWVRENLIDEKTLQPRWIEHPRLRAAVDVVAFPLTNLEGVAVYPLDLALRNTSIFLAPAEHVSIVGFPFAQTSGGGLAIWKSGTIASDPDVDYEGRAVFLVDATTKPGMSGSPVYARRSGAFLTAEKVTVAVEGTADKFLGIYAGRIDDQSEIGRVWKADVLIEIYQALQ